MSIAINSSLHVSFHCSRGVRQGDILSPLLFCLDEEVLNINISSFVASNKLRLIKATRNVLVLSHVLYDDDIFIFCSGRTSNIQSLTNLFTNYSLALDQRFNLSKSTIFAGAMSARRIRKIKRLTGFSRGSLPFTFLGLPIFKGRVTALQQLADRIIARFTSWKGSLLTMDERVLKV